MDKLDELMEAAILGGPSDLLDVAAELVKRQKALEAAMDRVFPGWRLGTLACLPNCQAACCET